MSESWCWPPLGGLCRRAPRRWFSTLVAQSWGQVGGVGFLIPFCLVKIISPNPQNPTPPSGFVFRARGPLSLADLQGGGGSVEYFQESVGGLRVWGNEIKINKIRRLSTFASPQLAPNFRKLGAGRAKRPRQRRWLLLSAQSPYRAHTDQLEFAWNTASKKRPSPIPNKGTSPSMKLSRSSTGSVTGQVIDRRSVRGKRLRLGLRHSRDRRPDSDAPQGPNRHIHLVGHGEHLPRRPPCACTS